MDTKNTHFIEEQRLLIFLIMKSFYLIAYQNEILKLRRNAILDLITFHFVYIDYPIPDQFK